MATRNHNLSKFDSPLPSAADMRFGIVVAEWNREVTEALLEGAVRTLRAAGCPDMNIQIKYVPGTFELSLGAQFFAEYTDVDAVIALGCVIQGDTRHFDFICQGVTQGITQLQIQWNMPIAFGVLTVNDMQQALDRCGGRHGNKGVVSRRPSTWSSCRSTWRRLRPTTNPTGGTSTDAAGGEEKGTAFRGRTFFCAFPGVFCVPAASAAGTVPRFRRHPGCRGRRAAGSPGRSSAATPERAGRCGRAGHRRW